MPGTVADQKECLSPDKGDGVMRITNVSQPNLNLFLVEQDDAPAPLVLVCPGGGYHLLAYNKEGTEIAEWLNSIGVSAAVLKYRVPNNRAGALEDARRAVGLVRAHADEWNVHPDKIGLLGFSAGGHLAAACSNSPDRPAFTILVYPAYLFQQGGIELSDDIHVDTNTPPAFIVQAQNDKKYYRSSLAYTAALAAQGIPAELHLFAQGGHGFGLRSGAHPISQWTKLCEQWMIETKIIER